jgi:hypothetical protein
MFLKYKVSQGTAEESKELLMKREKNMNIFHQNTYTGYMKYCQTNIKQIHMHGFKGAKASQGDGGAPGRIGA